MCRLFSIISKKPISPSFWFFNAKTPFKDFLEKKLSKGPHNSGWGVAYLKDNDWNIFKQGRLDVKNFNFNILNQISSKRILIHLRKASVGTEITKNTHPFIFKDFVFIHNGLVDKDLKSRLNEKFQSLLTSKTDSEIFFYLIMNYYEKTKDITKSIKKTIELIKKHSHKGLNFILSDKSNFYIYRDVNPEFQDLYNYYTLYYLIKENNIIISSDPLTEDNWIKLDLGELVIIDSELNIKKINLLKYSKNI